MPQSLRQSVAAPAAVHTAAPPPAANSTPLVVPDAPAALPAASLGSWLVWQCQMITGTLQGELFACGDPHGLKAPGHVWPEQATANPAMARAAARAQVESTPLCISATNPGPRSSGDILAYPVTLDGQVVAVVVMHLKPRSELQLRAVTQLLQWGILWLEALLRPSASAVTGSSNASMAVLRAALAHPQLATTVTAVCDTIAAQYKFDRVSVGWRDGLRTQLLGAMSSVHFERRSSLVEDLEAAMTEAADQGAPVIYPMSALPTLCHQGLARRHGMSIVCTVPLMDASHLYGAMTLERTRADPPSAELVSELTALSPLLGATLALVRTREQALSQRVRALVQRLARAKVVCAAILLAVAGLSVLPHTYRVSAKATIEGTIQRAVVAPVDGFVTESSVRAGDVVAAGATLAKLEDHDLTSERQKWQSELDGHNKTYGDALASHDRAQAAVARARMDQATAELKLVDEQLGRVVLKAPFAGIVVSGDLSQTLGAPVERGQVLFEVAPLVDYRVISEVDEHDVGEVRALQAGHLRLAGMPDVTFPLTVERITPLAVSENGKTFFRVESRLDAPSAQIRPGMQGITKFDAGQRSVMWTWTHGLWVRMRLKLWSLGI